MYILDGSLMFIVIVITKHFSPQLRLYVTAASFFLLQQSSTYACSIPGIPNKKCSRPFCFERQHTKCDHGSHNWQGAITLFWLLTVRTYIGVCMISINDIIRTVHRFYWHMHTGMLARLRSREPVQVNICHIARARETLVRGEICL